MKIVHIRLGIEPVTYILTQELVMDYQEGGLPCKISNRTYLNKANKVVYVPPKKRNKGRTYIYCAPPVSQEIQRQVSIN